MKTHTLLAALEKTIFLSLCCAVAFVARNALMALALFATTGLVSVAAEAGGLTEKATSGVHRERDYFEVTLPDNWTQVSHSFGLSPDEKKVYGVTLVGPHGGGGSAPRISAHYFAPDNLVDKTADKYIRVHSTKPPADGADFPALPKVKGNQVGGRKAEIFANVTRERGDGEKLAVIWESFAVLRADKGYYALRLSAPAARYAEFLPVFEAFLISFKPLLKADNQD